MLRKCFRKLFFVMLVINTMHCIAAEQKFTDHNGKAINFESYKNKWQLFIYVSSGCQYCRKEIVVLNELVGAYPDKLVVFGSNNEGLTNDELRDYVAKTNIKFSMLQQNPATLLRIKHIRMVPTMVIIKPNGDVLEPMVGLRTRQQLESVLFEGNK